MLRKLEFKLVTITSISCTATTQLRTEAESCLRCQRERRCTAAEHAATEGAADMAGAAGGGGGGTAETTGGGVPHGAVDAAFGF